MCLYSPEVTGTGRENNKRFVLTFLTGLKVFFFFFFWGSWQQCGSLCRWNVGKCTRNVTVWTSVTDKSHSYPDYFLFNFQNNLIQFSSLENFFCFFLSAAFSRGECMYTWGAPKCTLRKKQGYIYYGLWGEWNKEQTYFWTCPSCVRIDDFHAEIHLRVLFCKTASLGDIHYT